MARAEMIEEDNRSRRLSTCLAEAVMGKAFVVDMELVEFIINGVGLICESGWVLRERVTQKFPPAGGLHL